MMEKQFAEMVKIAEDALGSPKYKCSCPYTMCPYLNNNSVSCDTCVVLYVLYDNVYRKQIDGEWIPIIEEHKKVKVLTGYKCSCCKKEFSIGTEEEAEHFLATMLHCPNCGAHMKGGES